MHLIHIAILLIVAASTSWHQWVVSQRATIDIWLVHLLQLEVVLLLVAIHSLSKVTIASCHQNIVVVQSRGTAAAIRSCTGIWHASESLIMHTSIIKCLRAASIELLLLLEIKYGHLITTHLLLLVQQHIILIQMIATQIDHHVVYAHLALPATLLWCHW